jgi:RHS repeat-associated protein
VILLAEHDEVTLAAKKKRRRSALSRTTSTPKNRVWGFANTPSGRPVVELPLTQENATGSVRYTYQIASGRAEWLSRDPYVDAQGNDAELTQGANLYWYVQNNAVNAVDPSGLASPKIIGTILGAIAKLLENDIAGCKKLECKKDCTTCCNTVTITATGTGDRCIFYCDWIM